MADMVSYFYKATNVTNAVFSQTGLSALTIYTASSPDF